MPARASGSELPGREARGTPADASRSPVSIVIVSWNSRGLLLEALQSLLPLAAVESEVILVDNASTDGGPEAAVAAFPDLHVIRNATNLGFAAAVNVGLRASRHPLALLLNPDTHVLDDAVVRLVDYADATPKAGIVGPRVLNEDGSVQPSRFRFPSLLNEFLAATYLYQLFPGSAFFNRERLGGRTDSGPEAVDVVSGCCFLVRKAVINEVGALDEVYFMYAEETDLCYRASKAGWEVHYAPVGTIVHLGGGSSRLARKRNFLEIRRSVLRFFHKHRGSWSAEAARILMLLFLVLRVPYWGARAILPHRDRAHCATQLRIYVAGIGFLAKPVSRILETGPSRSPEGG